MEKHDFKILVVDDDEIVREVINSLLTKEGYAVVTAQDGAEAINILRIEDVHLVITDLRMPGVDGLGVLKYVVRNNPDCAVVMLTAFGTLDTTLEAIKEGAYDYLTKPFKIQEIIALTEKTYQRSLLIKDNRELRKYLRDMYHDLELLKTVADSTQSGVRARWIERIERLKSMSVFSGQEADVIQERLEPSNGSREDSHC
ncbi:MAG: response regulator [Nitrospirota bacterium]